MNIIVVIPLTKYSEEADRKQLVKDLRDLASNIEAYDKLDEPSYEHLEGMADLIEQRFPDSLPKRQEGF